MDVTPIPGSSFGAVVRGATISGDITPREIEEIWQALDEHLVIVFRGHDDPTDTQLMEFGRHFGHIPRTGLTNGASPEHNEILIISNIVENGRRIGVGEPEGMDWHTDYSFRPRVAQIGFLAAVELPVSGGGETAFTSTYGVYDSLPADVRESYRSYRARHALRSGYEDVIEEEYQGEVSLTAAGKAAGKAPEVQPEDGTSTVHPLIARNPRTGRRAVYANPLNTKRILELDPGASGAVLKELFARAGEPALTYTHTWQPGDLVMWDQLGTIHSRLPFDPAERRILRKVVTIFDDPAEPWREGGTA
ncbi:MULTISPECIES: neopentalenolactone/pentalenolactone F synthase [unclassified Streptomyces]|uniref:neopentalenolactone/pentalenolactone F synthase n=1 Tax=unclassified Streptomyces TaxID=2593676 RepID=UPI001CBD78CA|nr:MULTISPECIES: TauD/TfdA family dioxygenase [unclassified Streptomyces]WPO70797.1 TauD/TfdA family dioxygenase [Streptomyces sp. KN37]